MMLSLDTAYCSFGGEVEASSTPTICRLPDSRRHQLSAIAPDQIDRVSDPEWPLRAAQFLKPPALPGDTYCGFGRRAPECGPVQKTPRRYRPGDHCAMVRQVASGLPSEPPNSLDDGLPGG